MRHLLFPILVGLGGLAVLIGLGVWQLDRLEWKEGVLAGIDARMAADPVFLPEQVSEAEDEYRTVTFAGRPTGAELHVLVSGTQEGTGYRVISGFETQTGRRILLDQGLLPLEAKQKDPARPETEVTGTLLWPDDVNSSTPDPDLEENIWFGRDVAAMAERLETEPLLVVLSRASAYDPRLDPLPVSTVNIANDHLEYAITWFSLAAVWLAMSLYWLRRSTRREDPQA
ncbi:SURF1 family protein [Roseovarius sp. SYSU LYC5161]|uniref:SURF1 family protein n=1 Tax=Roseovarius halophilus (ex Wu et al. 2025) TaxID=3376060 RepID=UPI00399AD03D